MPCPTLQQRLTASNRQKFDKIWRPVGKPHLGHLRLRSVISVQHALLDQPLRHVLQQSSKISAVQATRVIAGVTAMFSGAADGDQRAFCRSLLTMLHLMRVKSTACNCPQESRVMVEVMSA